MQVILRFRFPVLVPGNRLPEGCSWPCWKRHEIWLPAVKLSFRVLMALGMHEWDSFRARTKIVLPRQNSRSHSKKSCGLRFLERQLTQPSEKNMANFFPSALEKMPIVLSMTCSSHLPKHFVCLLHRTTIECISKLRYFWEWRKDLDSHIRKWMFPKIPGLNWGWVDTASQDPHSSG